jgi:hypothetical protein
MAQFVRDTWGRYDPLVIAQLNEIAQDKCYQQKFYKAPAGGQEVFAPKQNVRYGLKIKPGSIVYGFHLPCSPSGYTPKSFSLQITDQAFQHTFWSEAIPSIYIANSLCTSEAYSAPETGTFPSLLASPYPVVGDGLFMIEMWETSGSGTQQRIELVIAALEVIDGSKPGVIPADQKPWYKFATGREAA